VFGCRKSPPALLTSIGESGSDGLLSFDEIARLRLDANLVVLSACDTASGVRDEALARQSGQEEGGSTLEGLVRAFLTANSRAVLATYWQVSAAAETNDLVRTFYTSARRENIGASLRTAQQQLMRNPEFSHPFYWGAYFVVGDSSKMMLSQPVQQASRQTASR
jgi:CHAT domain-containing protein